MKCFVVACSGSTLYLVDPVSRQFAWYLQAKEIQAEIGFFDLDPNRVVALILEAYAAQPGAAAFQRLLELFTREAVTQTLGFTLQHQGGAGAGETAEGLVLVVAHLVKVRDTQSDLTPYSRRPYAPVGY